MNRRESWSFFRAYSLGIASQLRLSGLPQGGGATDVCVRVGAVMQRPSVFDASGRGCWVNGDQVCYVLQDVGAFLVSNGKDILVEPCPEAVGEGLQLSLLGPAMALLLLQRGKFVLHAGSIAINGAAVAFLGGHGWGKSTLVAMLYARGHRFLCEDVAGLTFLEDHIQVIPSFPQLKLWPDAAQRLGWSPADFPQVHPDCEKRLIRFCKNFNNVSIPLRRIYVLRVAPRVSVERLRPVERQEAILRHWYGARFGPEFLRSLDRRNHFLRAAELARAVPVRALHRPATLHEDPGLTEAIEGEILRDLACADV